MYHSGRPPLVDPPSGPAVHAYQGHRELVKSAPHSLSAPQLEPLYRRPPSSPAGQRTTSSSSVTRYTEISQVTYEHVSSLPPKPSTSQSHSRASRSSSPPAARMASEDWSPKQGAGGKPPAPVPVQQMFPTQPANITPAMVEMTVRANIDGAVSRFAAGLFAASGVTAAGSPLPPPHTSQAAADAARALALTLDRVVAAHVDGAIDRVAQAQKQKKDERDDLVQALLLRLQALEAGVTQHVMVAERQQTELGLLHGRFSGMQKAVETTVEELARSAVASSTSCQGCKALANEVSELSHAVYALRSEASAIRNEMEEMRGMRGKLQAVDALLVAVGELQNGEQETRTMLAELEGRLSVAAAAAPPAAPVPPSPALAGRRASAAGSDAPPRRASLSGAPLSADPDVERRLEALEVMAAAVRSFLNDDPKPVASVRRPSGMPDGPQAPVTRAGLARDLTSLGARLDALSTQVVVVGAAAESVRAELRKERDGTRDRFAAVDRRLGGLADRLGVSPIAPGGPIAELPGAKASAAPVAPPAPAAAAPAQPAPAAGQPPPEPGPEGAGTGVD